MTEQLTRISFNNSKQRITLYSTAGCIGVLEGIEAFTLLRFIQMGFQAIEAEQVKPSIVNDNQKNSPVQPVGG